MIEKCKKVYASVELKVAFFTVDVICTSGGTGETNAPYFSGNDYGFDDIY
jgi:hypothetical protein